MAGPDSLYMEWLDMLEDVQAAKEAYAELHAAGGDRERAGWMRWDDVREREELCQHK
jgi:hypothetical protein